MVGRIAQIAVAIKMMVVSVFIIIILEYSARKNSANGPPAYSTLNPDTSSDSPSVRSKGVRLVSASVDTNHISERGHRGRISQRNSCVKMKLHREKPPAIKIAERIIRARVTSYEIVWATARRAPMRAYFELEAQPEAKIV